MAVLLVLVELDARSRLNPGETVVILSAVGVEGLREFPAEQLAAIPKGVQLDVELKKTGPETYRMVALAARQEHPLSDKEPPLRAGSSVLGSGEFWLRWRGEIRRGRVRQNRSPDPEPRP